MNWLIGGTATLIGLVALATLIARLPPATLASILTRGGGPAALAAALAFAFTGRAILAVPLAMLGLWLLGQRGASPLRSRPTGGGGGRTARSTVRSAALEMELDHETGVMRGRVLVGRFEGRELAHLSIADLVGLRQDFASDAESVTLLEAYLDRREPLWREHGQADAAAGAAGPADPGALSDEEAYQVLGLERGASEAEIREAHRRLMLAVHPDRGGSTFLAAKINAAKDRLLRTHGRRPH